MGQSDLAAVKRLEESVKNYLSEGVATHGLSLALRRLTKEIELYKQHLKGQESLQAGIRKKSARRVQIGGGSHYLEGFLNIDIVPPADIVWDVREELPLASESSELIFSEHLLEHLDYPASAKKLAKECFRVLEKGGRLILGVPNSEQAVRAYVTRDPHYFARTAGRWQRKRDCVIETYIDVLNYHFRDQQDDDKYSPHLWSYDLEKLEFMLKASGFTEIGEWEIDLSLVNPKRIDRTLYVVAVK